MRDAKALTGIAIVVGVALVGALSGTEGFRALSALGMLSSGLFAAAAAISLFAYRERRDPSLLLVGVGTAVLAVNRLVLLALADVTALRSAGWFVDVYAYSVLIGPLILAGNLLVVVPWVERRGRPPLPPGRVVVASVVALGGLDALAVLASPDSGHMGWVTLGGLGVFGWLSCGALAIAGLVIAVRSLGWGGRFSWIAAAGLSLSLLGIAVMLSTQAESERGGMVLTGWATVGPALAAGFLVVFVLASLHLESSRMRRTTDRAEEVLSGRAEIAAMVAHDVRGPLGTMKGLATTIRKNYEQLGDEERLEFIGMIERESTRLLGLVDHIALALRVDARTLDLQMRAQDLSPLVLQALDAVDTGERPVQVELADGVEAPVDAKWLPVAIGEGISNAARYSPAEAPIRLTLAATGADAVVEIADEGPGVPSERRDEVFQRFSRWRPPGYEDRAGSGLGLFICRGIAQAHGGDASLVEGHGGGTILRIRLPLEGTGSE